MTLRIEARLTYRFDLPCEVLLLLEAAHGADQTLHSESLRLHPPQEITRLDDALTGERRVVFLAEGSLDIRYDATVDIMPRGSRPGEGHVSPGRRPGAGGGRPGRRRHRLHEHLRPWRACATELHHQPDGLKRRPCGRFGDRC